MDKCLAGAYGFTCDLQTSQLGARRTFRVTDLRACQSQLSRRWPFRTQQCRHPARSPTTRKHLCSRDNGPLRLVLRASLASSGCAMSSSILRGGSTLHTLGCLQAQGPTEHCRHCVENLAGMVQTILGRSLLRTIMSPLFGVPWTISTSWASSSSSGSIWCWQVMSCPNHRSATNKNWCKMLMHMSEYCLCGPAGFGKDLMLGVVAAGLSLIICSACNLTSPIISGILFEILTGRQPISRSVLLPVDCRNFHPKCPCMQLSSALRVLDYVLKHCICAEKSKACSCGCLLDVVPY